MMKNSDEQEVAMDARIIFSWKKNSPNIKSNTMH